VPFILLAERKGYIKPVFLGAITLLVLVEFGLASVPFTLAGGVALLFLFFTAFNLLEAMLPSLVSRVAPADCRGTAMGFYSSTQFFGAFVGGALGGWLHGQFGLHSIFMCAAAGALVWLGLAATMVPPPKLATLIHPVSATTPDEVAALTRQLAGLPGVAEAVVVAEEGVAYLKVDRRLFDASQLTGV
jgi:MFS family permease